MAAGDPTGPDLASVTVSTTSLQKSPLSNWVTFTFDTPYSLSSNTDYAIVVGTTGVSIGDMIEWSQDTNAGFATGQGYLSSDSGVNWVAAPTRDRAFRVNDADGDRDKYETANAWQADYDPWFIGQTFNSAAQSYVAISVDLQLRKTTTSPPGTVTISLRRVEGSAPGKATLPNPSDASSTVSTNKASLSWTQGSGATTENVYFGLSGNMSLVESGNTTQSFSLADYLPLPHGTAYQWRIDSINENGTTTGDTWSFTTLTYVPPSISDGSLQVLKRLCACANDKFWYEDI